MKDNTDIKITVDSKTAIKEIEKTRIAAEKLKSAIDRLNTIEIVINVREIKQQWWKFWI